MKIKEDSKDEAALTLRWLVEEEARDLSGEVFARFMDHLYKLITTFLDSNEVFENLGALRAIDELIDVTRDPEILVLASKVLGHLDRSGGAMTADEVESQVKVSLEWLRGERIEYRRFATILILKEMVKTTSTVFNVHVPDFVDVIWVHLRDPTLVVREKDIEALRVCLHVIEKRETSQDGLGRNVPVHSIHGSLLTVGELLRFLGDGWLHEEGGGQVRASGFIALGEIVAALDGELTNYLPTITSHLRDAIAPHRGRPSLEALACVGNIAKAMGPTMEPHVRGLLDSMFSFGLSLTLVEALEQITESIPPLLPTIQNRLLKYISAILSRSYHSMPRQSASFSLRLDWGLQGHDLLVFAREFIVMYLEDENGATRKDVALCCYKLVSNSFSVISSTQFSLSRINCASGKRCLRLVEEV
ncbi:hypothetical protein CQW23_31722 [Capsicum baccatum]|uniref:Serine/threonine-protein kinase TOR n=1 Tax=Capsicum baccatum TaxID=33114 RepID=A0A2G2V6Q8_CAPBA|nr:hypothetical protein CQW23_31722 [Capsicum baccatum]